MEDKLKEWGLAYTITQVSKRRFVVRLSANSSSFRLFGAISLLQNYFLDWCNIATDKKVYVKGVDPFTLSISFTANADAMLFKLSFLEMT
jgi:hypothetical protein